MRSEGVDVLRPTRPRKERKKKDTPKLGDQEIPLSNKKTRALISDAFGHSPSLIIRNIRTGHDRGVPLMAVYLLGLVDLTLVATTVLNPLLSDHRLPITRTNAADLLAERLLTNAVLDRVETMEAVIEKIMAGRVVILPEGSRTGLACDVSSTPNRAIQEPETEGVARGPREGFIESIEQNLSLVRRRLRTADLRIEPFTMGRHTHTRVALVYIASIAAESVIQEARSRLNRINDNVDGILVSESVAELIEDHPYALFPTINATERPERVAASLLEGRFAVFVEGSPFTLMAPTLFAEFLTTSADNTERAITVSLLRAVRMLSLVATLFLPSIYVALVSFHQETIPTLLLLSIAVGREGVPFPPIAEALLMETAFEVLREAGLRLPRSLGGAVSIVGVLVVGQAAVSAGIVSPILIIIVGGTAVSSFTVPNFPTANVLRVLRFPILLITGAFGAIGIVFCFILLTLHLVSLRSFGVPYLSPLAPFRADEVAKGLVRQPAWSRTKRPAAMWQKNIVRQTPDLMPHPSKGDDNDRER